MFESLDPWFLDHLICPATSMQLRIEGNYLVSPEGRRYPVVNGVPVMLVPGERQTIALAERSLAAAERISSGESDDRDCIETLGLSDAEKAGVRVAMAEGEGAIDPAVSYLVGATNGIAYKSVIGQLKSYPIPDLRLPDGHGRLLLDIGCNWGRWCLAAAKKGYSPVGIDPSLGAVLAARRVARSMGIEARFVVGDARFLPFRPASFDVAFSYSVLQHFAREDADVATREMGRILKPGGVGLVQMPNALGIRCLYHQLRRRLREGQGFEVRYYWIAALRKMFGSGIGPTMASVDCYFGLGLQRSDLALMSLSAKAAVVVSEGLRALSRAIPPLTYLADSVYLTSRKPASLSCPET